MKAIYLSLLIYLLPIFSGQSQSLVPFKTSGKKEKWGYKNRKGRVIIKPIYDYAEGYRKNAAKVSRKGKYGLIDEIGRVIVPVKYQEVQSQITGHYVYFRVKKGKKYGLFTDWGNQTIPFKYTRLDGFILNYWSRYKATLNQSTGIVDENDKVWIDFKYDDLWQLPNNKDRGIYKTVRAGKWGLVREQIKVREKNAEILPCIYDSIQVYSTTPKLYKYYKGKKYGLFGEYGNILLKAAYDSVQRVGRYIYYSPSFLVTKNGLQGLYDADGKMLLAPKYKRIEILNKRTLLGECYTDQGMGIFEGGQMIVPAQYDEITPLERRYQEYRGLLWLKKGTRYALYDGVQRKLLTKFDYESVGLTIRETSLIFARKDGKTVYLNTQGKLVVPAIYDQVRYLGKQLIKVKKNNLYGILDTSGKVMVPIKYDQVRYLRWQLIKVKKNNLYGILDTSGKVVVSVKYDALKVYRPSRKHPSLFVVSKGKRQGIVYQGDQVILPIVYDQITMDYSTSSAPLIVKKGTRYALYDALKKQWVTHFRYTYLAYPEDYDTRDVYLLASKGINRWGYVNQEGKEPLAFVYQRVAKFINDKAIVQRAGKYFYIDQKGKYQGAANAQEFANRTLIEISSEYSEVPPPPVKSDGYRKRIRKVDKRVAKAQKPRGFEQYLKDSLRYPKRARRYKVEGEVILSAVVDDRGQLIKIQVLEGLGYGCNQEAIRLLKSAPRWTPAVGMEWADEQKEIFIVNFQLPKRKR